MKTDNFECGSCRVTEDDSNDEKSGTEVGSCVKGSRMRKAVDYSPQLRTTMSHFDDIKCENEHKVHLVVVNIKQQKTQKANRAAKLGSLYCARERMPNLYFEGNNFQNELDSEYTGKENVQVVERVCVMSALTLILQTTDHHSGDM